MSILEQVEVEYKTFAGWMTPISGCRDFNSLPENAKIYIKFIEEFLNVPIKYIGVGKEREAVIEM